MIEAMISPKLTILPAILILCFSVVGQPRQDTGVKQELALSISSGDDLPWELPAFHGAGGGASVVNFKRIESWEPSSEEETVKEIDFKIAREGDIVIAHLSVRLENEKELMVGTYRMREGETIKVEELTKFGLEPLVLKVVKAKPNFKDPLPPITPRIENKTKVIEVVGFYQEEHASERFRLTLRNTSEKNIMALDLFMPSPNGNGGSGYRSRGAKGQPVMLPGGISVQHIGLSRGGQTTPEGFVPDPALQQTLTIRTVVFDDGTYDGLVEPAAEMAAQRKGLDIQRGRILQLLQEPIETDQRDAAAVMSDLKEKAYALTKTADASATLELIALFPSLNKESKNWLTHSVEEGLREGKLEFLRYLNDFEANQKQSGERLTLAELIKQLKADYEKRTITF